MQSGGQSNVWLEHIGVTVSDITVSLPFYEGLFDAKAVDKVLWAGREAEYVADMLDAPGLELCAAFVPIPGTRALLEIIQYSFPEGYEEPKPLDPNPTAVGAMHLGWFVDDLESWVAILRKRNVRFIGPIVGVPYGPYHGGRSIYFRDPDGHLLQLMEVVSRPGGLPVLRRSEPVPRFESF